MTALSDDERARFRRFLRAQGYDPGVEDLMVNETRAYLMHTPDSRFFNARDVDLALSRLAALRAMFLVGMPNGRLRDCTPAPGGLAPGCASRPRRRGHRDRGAVVVACRQAPSPKESRK